LKSQYKYDKLGDSEASSQLKDPILESKNIALATKTQELKEDVSALVCS